MVLFNQPGSEAAYAWMETQMFLDEPGTGALTLIRPRRRAKNLPCRICGR